MACDLPEPRKFPSQDSCQKTGRRDQTKHFKSRILFAHTSTPFILYSNLKTSVVRADCIVFKGRVLPCLRSFCLEQCVHLLHKSVTHTTQVRYTHHTSLLHTPHKSITHTTQVRYTHHTSPLHTPHKSVTHTTQVRYTHHTRLLHTPHKPVTHTTQVLHTPHKSVTHTTQVRYTDHTSPLHRPRKSVH